MKRKNLLYIPIVLIAIFVLILITKFINYNNKSSKNIIDNKANKTNQTENRIKTIIDESYTYYLLTEGDIPTTEEDVVFVDNIKYLRVTINGINSKNDIKTTMEDLFTTDYANGRYEEVLEKRKFVDNNNKLYVLIDKEPCQLNYSLEDKLYEIIKTNDTESELKFTIDESHEYIYPIYNEAGKYKIIDSIYSCTKNIKDN